MFIVFDVFKYELNGISIQYLAPYDIHIIIMCIVWHGVEIENFVSHCVFARLSVLHEKTMIFYTTNLITDSKILIPMNIL